MSLEGKTLKELRELCKEKNLKVSGNKKDLVERLEFCSANNTLNIESRVRELEETINRLKSVSVAEGDPADSILDSPERQFTPNEVSSPCPISVSMTMGTHSTNVRSIPVVSSAAEMPAVTIEQRVSQAFANVSQANASQHQVFVSAPVAHASAIPREVYVSAQAALPTSVVPQQVYVAAPRYHQVTSMVPNTYVSSTQPTYTGGQQYFPQGVSNQFVPSYAPAPWCLQPTYVPQNRDVHMMPSMVPAMNVKDIISVLPEFDPTADDSLSSTQFVQRVQILRNSYQWGDDVLLFAVQKKLRGHAKYWVDSLNEVFRSWTLFAERLVETFPFNDNAADAHSKMANTIRGANESPQEYYYKMLSLGTKYGMLESVIARHIINGINEFNLKRKISNDYVSCASLLKDIDSYCRFNDIRNENDKKGFFSNSQVAQTRVAPKQSHERTSDVKAKQLDQGIKCYNCKKHGHISTNCPEPQRYPKCRNCNKHHHQTAACKTAAKVNKVEVAVKPNDELFKTVVIGDWTGQAIVDSGSDKTLVRKSILAKFGPLVEGRVKLHGFGGGECESTASKKVNMIIDGHANEVDALAVEDEFLQSDVLIGRDVLCQQGTRVVIENNSCFIEKINTTASEVSDLESTEREKLKEILAEYQTCFAESIQDLGTCTVKKLEIKLTTDVPVNVKPYRLPFAKRDEARAIIDELLRAKIIEHSDSAYASPVVLVPKKDGTLRMCVDYRQLNRITVKTPFPMPIMEECFAQLAGNRYFTCVDLRMGYHQIEIAEQSRKYTAFVTVDGHYQYTRMPFGLVNAPAVFQDIMNTLVKQMDPGEVLAYLDDVIIPSKTVDEGLLRLEKFLKVLRCANLKLRLDKCTFLATEITFLGHKVSVEGITPGFAKVSAIRDFTIPTNVTEVRRFLGLTGFFRKFIPNYALIVKPITQLLHKSEIGKFNWGEQQNYHFRKLIELLCDKPVLVLYDPKAYHEVHTDASKIGLAGVLLQSYDEKNWQAVAYYSRHCTDAESRYHAYELEVLAVVETLTRFRVYLLGKFFRLVTDCSAIAKARTQKELIPKIARWYMRLMEFDFEAIHRSGEKLAHVDALSRAPNEPSCDVATAGFVYQTFIEPDDWLYTMQLQDSKLKHIILVLRGELKDEQEAQIKQEYKLKQSRLYRQDDGLKFVVPKAIRWRIVKSCHDDAGHFGVDKTVARVKQKFWFPRMRNYVKSYIAACVECCFAKANGGKTEAQMHIGEVEPRPFSTLHLDHLGPFIKSARGMSYVLAISDAFSKFLVIKPVRNTKTAPVIAALLDITTYFGLPKKLITDRGTAFTSKLFADFCDTNCIQHVKTAVRTPRSNGQVERANQIILAGLRTSGAKPKDWDMQLRDIQWAVNSQRNATTGYSPNELVFDFNLRDLTHNKLLAILNDDDSEDSGQLSTTEKRQHAAENIQTERAKWKQRFDRKHATPTVYDEDELVLVANEAPSTGESRKLEPKYKGPYVVAKVLGHDRYLIKDIPGMQITQKPFESVFAADKLRKWCCSSPELDGNAEDEDEEEDESLEDEPRSGTAELSALNQ